jgi:hypothetical protein
MVVNTKHAYNIVAAVELAWLMHYPRPSIITFGKEMEFLAEFSYLTKMIMILYASR